MARVITLAQVARTRVGEHEEHTNAFPGALDC
jgi:hypothetical protein